MRSPRGIITSIGQDSQMPNHLSVTIAHGKRKPSKKGEPMPSYDDRPKSHMYVHKRHAADYVVGKMANTSISPSSMDGEGPDETEDDGDGDDQGAALANLRKTTRNIAIGKRG